MQMKHWVRFIKKNNNTFVEHFGEIDVVKNIIYPYTGDMFGEHEPSGEALSLDAVQLLTPCQPSKYVGLWNNYHALAQQLKQSVPAEPLYFIKGANSYLSPLEEIRSPASYDGRVMYEGELGIVIGSVPGKLCKSVTEEDASSFIFGYTCVNDVTAIDILYKDSSFAQWARAKSFDTFGPFGPYICSGVDWKSLSIKTHINGRERQNYLASDMIFSPAQIVSHLSAEMTLNPGDLIACGTSVGALPMRAGSTVEINIEGVGTLSNTFMTNGVGK
jgi:2-keto-4-pentenoate hydratase/2-oxohepta-3-ene-1,7-dioic acid hydratase in catechol pathway